MTWDDGAPYVEKLAAGVYAYVQPHGGWMVNNCGIVTDASGEAVLVDTAATERRTRGLLAEVVGLAARGPRIAVNTHHHPDHTYGNCFLPPTTTIVGHHLCREGMIRAGLSATEELPADYGGISVRPPEITFADRLTLHLGGFGVELTTMGPAHSTNDVAVWLPEQRVLFAGDLVFSGGHPIFMEGSMLGFKAALGRMRELEPEALLPGHGPACRGEQVGRVLTDLEEYVDYVAALAADSHAAGLSPLEAAQRHKDDSPYRDWPEGERLVCNLHRAYVELTDYEPPFRLSIPNLWREMVALHGGPIVSHA